MRKKKTVEIEISEGLKKEITVFEIRPMDIKKVFEDVKGKATEEIFEKILHLCTSNMRKEDFTELYPSEIELVWNTFKEVNSSFFKTVGKLEIVNYYLNVLMNMIQKKILEEGQKLFKELQIQLADSSEADTSKHGDMGGSSLPPQ